MIKLEKGPIPAILVRKAEEWTQELQAEIAAGTDGAKAKSSRYAHKEIKQALLDETNEKCAYCESKPLHVTFGDVEHIAPKNNSPDQAYDWSNLTLACSVCNTHKGIKQNLVDPYVIDPDGAFDFYGPAIVERPEVANAKRTRIELELNRKELLSQRNEMITQIRGEMMENRNNPDPLERALTEEAIIEHYKHKSSQFSACARHFLNDFVAKNPL